MENSRRQEQHEDFKLKAKQEYMTLTLYVNIGELTSNALKKCSNTTLKDELHN